MSAIFIEGWVFLLLTVTGARAKLITYVPRSIALAMSAGRSLSRHSSRLQAVTGYLELWAVTLLTGTGRCARTIALVARSIAMAMSAGSLSASDKACSCCSCGLHCELAA